MKNESILEYNRRMKMKNKNIVEIVEKLIGHIDSIGETNYDNKSLENLSEYADLCYDIIGKLVSNLSDKHHYEASRKEVGENSERILMIIYEEIMDIFDGRD